MMIRDHFESCPVMSSELKAKYKDIKATASQGVDGSKQYWVLSAKKLGLVETDSALLFLRRGFGGQRGHVTCQITRHVTRPELVSGRAK
eukprot:9914339-Ditylum_brightwellii.AAC.1